MAYNGSVWVCFTLQCVLILILQPSAQIDYHGLIVYLFNNPYAFVTHFGSDRTKFYPFLQLCGLLNCFEVFCR